MDKQKSQVVYEQACERIKAGKQSYADEVLVGLWQLSASVLPEVERYKQQLKESQKKLAEATHQIDILSSRIAKVVTTSPSPTAH